MHRLLLALAVTLALAPAAHAWSWPADGRVLAPFSFDPANPDAAGHHGGVVIAAGARIGAPRAGSAAAGARTGAGQRTRAACRAGAAAAARPRTGGGIRGDNRARTTVGDSAGSDGGTWRGSRSCGRGP